MLIVRSPVRISFGGGGTDLPSYYERFGGVVLSAAINKYFYTVLEKRGDGKIQIISADLRTVETWQDIARMDIRGNALEIPLAVLKESGCDVSVNLFLASEIPPGTGLGSSASVCVNLTKMLATYSHISLSKYELAERAYHIARNVLGRPVGKQDEYASAFGGLNFISFHPDGTAHVEPLGLEPELVRELQSSLLLFFTGASHHSWTILEEQERSTRKPDGGTVEYLHCKYSSPENYRSLACCSTKVGRLRSSFRRKSLMLVSTRCTKLPCKTAPWEAKSRAQAAADFCYCFAGLSITKGCATLW
jgi:D-glycero-alpha-D-manno-heptose-7-phosphate kinase